MQLHLFLDKTVLDIYADGGAVTQITAVKNARPEDIGVELFAEGGEASVVSLELYRLRAAHFDRKAFR